MRLLLKHFGRTVGHLALIAPDGKLTATSAIPGINIDPQCCSENHLSAWKTEPHHSNE